MAQLVTIYKPHKPPIMALLNSNNLKTAIDFLSDIHEGHVITAIQFEDGSGHKFNYQLDGTGQWIYINLSKAFKAARANDTYFTTLARAIEYAIDTAEIRGFQSAFNYNGFMNHLPIGRTWKVTSQLLKDGKLQTKQLHISIYRMDSGNYELTHYIN